MTCHGPPSSLRVPSRCQEPRVHHVLRSNEMDPGDPRSCSPIKTDTFLSVGPPGDRCRSAAAGQENSCCGQLSRYDLWLGSLAYRGRLSLKKTMLRWDTGCGQVRIHSPMGRRRVCRTWGPNQWIDGQRPRTHVAPHVFLIWSGTSSDRGSRAQVPTLVHPRFAKDDGPEWRLWPMRIAINTKVHLSAAIGRGAEIYSPR